MIKIKTPSGKILDIQEYFSFPDVIENIAQLEGVISKVREIAKTFLREEVKGAHKPKSMIAKGEKTMEGKIRVRRTAVKLTNSEMKEFVKGFASTKDSKQERQEFITKWKCVDNGEASRRAWYYRQRIK